MRTLLALTVLMLALAGAVWWKTRPADDIGKLPPTTASDSRVGVATVGMEKGTTIPKAKDASFPKKRPFSDAPGDHEGEEGKTSLAANTPGEDSVVPPTPPVVEPEPTPPPVVESKSVRHTIVQGDTLYTLVKLAYGTAPEALIDAVAEANNLKDPGSLQPGQVILLPVVDGFSAPKKP